MLSVIQQNIAVCVISIDILKIMSLIYMIDSVLALISYMDIEKQ